MNGAAVQLLVTQGIVLLTSDTISCFGSDCNNNEARLFCEQFNGEPSSARCLYWSQMKVVSFCFEKNFNLKNQNNLAFHRGPVETPSGKGSPFRRIAIIFCHGCSNLLCQQGFEPTSN